VTRVFELSGVDSGTQQQLVDACGSVGVACVSRPSDGAVLLVGTKSSYDELTEGLSGVSGQISRVAERIRKACC